MFSMYLNVPNLMSLLHVTPLSIVADLKKTLGTWIRKDKLMAMMNQNYCCLINYVILSS